MSPIHPIAPEEDTERFTRQACPRCGAVAIVPLCLSTTSCDACDEAFEVAPLRSDDATLEEIPAYDYDERELR